MRQVRQVKLNIVVGDTDMQWVGGRLARELVARLPQYGFDAAINSPDGASLHYEQIVYSAPQRRPAVGLFTHGSFRPHKFALAFDGHIALNNVMAQYLIEGGATDPAVIALCVGEQFKLSRPLVFGVAGRTYADGRKGEHLVAAMVEAGYKVIAWGSGWPCEIVSSDLDDLPYFYRSLDYYIDTSADEGGCVPALEAMACGVPVISHTVGVERPVLAYERGDKDDLLRLLKQITQPRTYEHWAADHAAVFKAMLA